MPANRMLYLFCFVLFAFIPLYALAQGNFNMSLISRTFAQWQTVEDIAIAGDYAYISTRDTGLFIMNISDAGNPEVIASFEVDEPIIKAVLRDGILYVLAWHSLSILDVAAPSDPVLLGTYHHLGRELKQLALEGDYAYLSAPEDEFMVVNISDLSHPYLQTGTLGSGVLYSGGLAKTVDYLYAATYSSLDIYTCFNPANLQHVSNVPLYDGIASIEVVQNRVYVAGSQHGVYVLTNLGYGSILHSGQYYTHGAALSLSVNGSIVYVANDRDFVILQYGGNGIYDDLFPEAEMTNSIRNHPNPFNPGTTIDFAVQRSGNVDISIYNIRGQSVRTLSRQEFSRGEHSLYWDGKDDNGNVLCSGLYLLKLKAGRDIRVGKMLMMK